MYFLLQAMRPFQGFGEHGKGHLFQGNRERPNFEGTGEQRHYWGTGNIRKQTIDF